MENENTERKRPGQEECLVCFASLGGGQGFAQVLHQGDMAKFCSLECLEIFQNNPASFLKRMKVPSKAVPAVEHMDESGRAESARRRSDVA